MTAAPEDAGLRRLHPLFLLFSLAGAARNLIVPGLVVVFASGGSGWESILMVFFLPAAAYAVVRYIRLRYRLGRDELVVTGGLLTSFERHIPYDRIQNINLVQNLMHRLFRVASVKIETASGEEPEASMEVLSLDQVEEIRRRVYAHGETDQAGDGDGEAREVVLELPTREIVLSGIISNRGLAVVLAALGLAYELELLTEERVTALASGLPSWVPDLVGTFPLATAFLIGAAVVALVVMMRLLSITWALVELFGFRLTRRGDELQAVYGLFTRVVANIPRRRIQLVSWRETWMHRWFRRLEVRVVTAGSLDDSEKTRQRTKTAPIAHRRELPRLIGEIHPSFGLDEIAWFPVERVGWRRVAFKLTVVAVAACAALSLAFGTWVFAALAALLPLVAYGARRWVDNLRYGLGPEGAAYREGWVTRVHGLVRYSKIQVVSLHQSPFDRRWGMATVRIDTAGSAIFGQRFAIPFIALDEAERLVDRLTAEAARRDFEW